MAQYLPVLLVSVSAVSSNLAPDDSSLDTQAIGQVDYLSYEWQEEDVAKSWRNMTRRKDTIQNGARLENASWRTWWKQRNNLPTVSPETLNWLKDSDVTWLYGPLHTAADWTPPPRQSLTDHTGGASSPTSPSLRPSTLQPDVGLRPRSSRPNTPWALKPILKHRSISELLSISLPPSPSSDPIYPDEDNGYFPSPQGGGQSGIMLQESISSDVPFKRPKLTHTKSDSNVHQPNAFLQDSPPLSLHVPSESRDSSCDHPSGGAHTSQRGRHISFNTFVEQCIAIESPKKDADDYFDEHETNGGPGDEDDDESEDDVLEMRPSPRSRTGSSRRTPSLSGGSASTSGHDVSSPEREHVTIAPIAPTVLKTSTSPSPDGSRGGYGSMWEDDPEDPAVLFTRTPADQSDSVNLVYVPPQGSVYAERLSTHFGGKISPPRADVETRASSFDDAAILRGRRLADKAIGASLNSRLDYRNTPEVSTEYTANHTVRSRRSPPQSRSSSAVDLNDDSPSRSGSSEDATVVPPLRGAAILAPRAHAHARSSATPSPVSSGSGSGSPDLLEPPARGRSTSPITVRDRDSDPPRGRSLSRGSIDGSVSPRSGSRNRLGGPFGASPTWRDKSLSPEEEGDGSASRPVKRAKRLEAGNGESSASPPSTMRERDDERRVRFSRENAGGESNANSADLPIANPPPPPTEDYIPLPRLEAADSEEPATLVARATDIVSSARDYIGAFWIGDRHSAVHHPDTVSASTAL